MSDQVTLTMPCFQCLPACFWPPNENSVITVSVAQFFAQACVNCIELNITYFPVLVSKTVIPGGNVICVWEVLHPAGTPCGVEKLDLVVSGLITGDVLIQARLLDIFGFQFARWAVTLTPAQQLTNGPFDMTPMSISFALCTQITVIPVVLQAFP